jgi:hypothetical protein
MLSKNANAEKQIEHLVKIWKAISEWKVYARAARIRSIMDDTCLQDHLTTTELQLPLYWLTEAIRI